MCLRTLKWEAFRILLESGSKNSVLPCLTDSKAQSWCRKASRWARSCQVPHGNERGTDEVTYRVLGKGLKRKTTRPSQRRGNNKEAMSGPSSSGLRWEHGHWWAGLLPRSQLKKIDKAAGIQSSILLWEWQPISSLPESADEALGEFSLIYSLVSQDW